MLFNNVDTDVEILKQVSNYDSKLRETAPSAIAAEVVEQDFFQGIVDLSSYGVGK